MDNQNNDGGLFLIALIFFFLWRRSVTRQRQLAPAVVKIDRDQDSWFFLIFRQFGRGIRAFIRSLK